MSTCYCFDAGTVQGHFYYVEITFIDDDCNPLNGYEFGIIKIKKDGKPWKAFRNPRAYIVSLVCESGFQARNYESIEEFLEEIEGEEVDPEEEL